MKSKLVIVLALVGFSTSVFAQKAIDAAKVSAKAKESKERIEKKEATEEKLSLELIKEAGLEVSKPEMIEAGLEAQFGSKLAEKLEFRARLSTAATSGDVQQQYFAKTTLQLVGKLGSYTKGSVKNSETDAHIVTIKRILKNIELTSMNEAAEKFMSQVEAVNTALYTKNSSKTPAEIKAKLTAENIELIGIANVKKADLGITGTKTILTLDGMSEKQLSDLKKFLEIYKADC